jgi:hypothetical protein
LAAAPDDQGGTGEGFMRQEGFARSPGRVPVLYSCLSQ